MWLVATGQHSYTCIYLYVICFKVVIFITTIQVKKSKFPGHPEAFHTPCPTPVPSKSNPYFYSHYFTFLFIILLIAHVSLDTIVYYCPFFKSWYVFSIYKFPLCSFLFFILSLLANLGTWAVEFPGVWILLIASSALIFSALSISYTLAAGSKGSCLNPLARL